MGRMCIVGGTDRGGGQSCHLGRERRQDLEKRGLCHRKAVGAPLPNHTHTEERDFGEFYNLQTLNILTQLSSSLELGGSPPGS